MQSRFTDPAGVAMATPTQVSSDVLRAPSEQGGVPSRHASMSGEQSTSTGRHKRRRKSCRRESPMHPPQPSSPLRDEIVAECHSSSASSCSAEDVVGAPHAEAPVAQYVWKSPFATSANGHVGAVPWPTDPRTVQSTNGCRSTAIATNHSLGGGMYLHANSPSDGQWVHSGATTVHSPRPTVSPFINFPAMFPASPHLSHQKRALGQFRRVWCCLCTHDGWHSIFIAIPVVVFSVVFMAAVVPSGEWYSYLITSLFLLLSLLCLCLAVSIDPGIVPPLPYSEMPREQVQQVRVNGTSVECKVCYTCHILRPPRSTHCQFCDVCVEEFDHHCGVLGSCVARRTFRFFGGFFIVTSLLSTYMLVRSIIVLQQIATSPSPSEETGRLAAAIICALAPIFASCCLIPCSTKYIVFACCNLTDKEYLRNKQFCSPNYPYHDGNCCFACLRRYFSPLGSSQIEGDYIV